MSFPAPSPDSVGEHDEILGYDDDRTDCNGDVNRKCIVGSTGHARSCCDADNSTSLVLSDDDATVDSIRPHVCDYNWVTKESGLCLVSW